jgi:hypothetical protein
MVGTNKHCEWHVVYIGLVCGVEGDGIPKVSILPLHACMAPEEVLYYSIITLEIPEKLWILFLTFLEERN